MNIDTEVTISNLIEKMLKAIPEIKSEYEEEAKRHQTAQASLSREDQAVLNAIAEIHALPRTKSPIGETVVFENIVSPFIASIATNSQQKRRLKEIMEWIEELANSNDKWVRNIVAGSICEPLLTTHQSQLKNIVPYMGETTKELCRMQLERWILSDETKQLFMRAN